MIVTTSVVVRSAMRVAAAAHGYSCPVIGTPGSCMSTPGHACMQETQAIAIASALARKEGIDPANFFDPTAMFECVQGTCDWRVVYKGKDRLALGNHFSVRVNDSNCATNFQRGL